MWMYVVEENHYYTIVRLRDKMFFVRKNEGCLAGNS